MRAAVRRLDLSARRRLAIFSFRSFLTNDSFYSSALSPVFSVRGCESQSARLFLFPSIGVKIQRRRNRESGDKIAKRANVGTLCIIR